ncbi:hypothetical protein DPMN_070448 [Dreissena polymorpha]|uniref:SAM domain-containing protein n=1 Tax=Dreissena polymorpha TaxID=45954 RepID=A0A9D3Z5F7_DREPO|nr:hypothetical protein DPMN_070448 [Dreissena polymorpha]
MRFYAYFWLQISNSQLLTLRVVLVITRHYEPNKQYRLHEWLHGSGLKHYFESFLQSDRLDLAAVARLQLPDEQLYDELEITLSGHKRRLERAEFMVDSGSDVVILRQTVLDTLDLELIGPINSKGVHASRVKNLYKANILIGNTSLEIEFKGSENENRVKSTDQSQEVIEETDKFISDSSDVIDIGPIIAENRKRHAQNFSKLLGNNEGVFAVTIFGRIRTDGRTDGRAGEGTVERTDGQTDGRTHR